MPWAFDPYHTQVGFSAKHLGMMTVRGHFTDVTATGAIYPENPAGSSFEVTIQTASIKTNHEGRDNDLRSGNFLEVDKYPTITFKSTKIDQTGPDNFLLTGDLTIKGITHPVTLDVVRYGEFNDPRMGHRIGYAAEGKINRKEFGLTFNAILDGRLVVGEDITISIEGEFVEQPQEQTAGTTSA
jgi:polyisoprenoid-binding protein YceI